MTSPHEALVKLPYLTFTKVCSCGGPTCIDCRSWVTEADVPLVLEGPVIPAIANTMGVDGVRLVQQRYTLVTIIARAFDPEVVMHSIRENVASAGPVSRLTGLSGMARPPAPAPPKPPAAQQDATLSGLVAQCSAALTCAAQALENRTHTVLEIDDHSIVYDGRRFVQIYPKPKGRSRLRAALLRWLAD